MYIDHGYKFSRNTNNVNVSWVQEQPSNVDGVFKQTVPQYSYNTAYSLNKTIGQNYSTISYDTKDKQSYPYRCRYSEKKRMESQKTHGRTLKLQTIQTLIQTMVK